MACPDASAMSARSVPSESAVITQNVPLAAFPRFDQLRPSTVDQSSASPLERLVPYAVPAGSTAIRSKPGSVHVTVAARDVPPPGAPASGAPASGGPASG